MQQISCAIVPVPALVHDTHQIYDFMTGRAWNSAGFLHLHLDRPGKVVYNSIYTVLVYIMTPALPGEYRRMVSCHEHLR